MNVLALLFGPFLRGAPRQDRSEQAPPLARMPRIPIRPPHGFRFGSEPPSLDCIVHLDNDRPYHGARRGERLLIFEGMLSQRPLGEGQVIGRMDSDDPRANSRARPAVQGIYFRNEHGDPEWRPCQRLSFWRREDGVLTLKR